MTRPTGPTFEEPGLPFSDTHHDPDQSSIFTIPEEGDQ